MIRWLEKNGDSDNEFTPGEAIAMKEDIQRLKDSGAQFARDAHRVFEMSRGREH